MTLARFELLVLERRERIRKELRNERCESSSDAFICKFVVIDGTRDITRQLFAKISVYLNFPLKFRASRLKVGEFLQKFLQDLRIIKRSTTKGG